MTAASLDKLSVETLSGIGPALATKLKKLGLYSLQDLLFHLPLRYIDRTQITPIGGIQPMTEVVIEGEVRASDVVFGRRRSLVCRFRTTAVW
jgi:ATP-dependent DNA helicase RecG